MVTSVGSNGSPGKRLCILTQYFPPEMGAPQGRLSELGALLQERGWLVEVLTAVPNYPTGRIFPGYPRWRPLLESVSGLRTARVPLVPAQRGFGKRLACYLSFACMAAALGPRLLGRPDVLWVESPPLFTGVAAVVLGRRWRCPFVFNVSDLWPESAVRMGILKAGVAYRVAERVECWVYRRAAVITGQSEEILENIVARNGPLRTCLITNGVDPDRFDAARRRRDLLGFSGGDDVIFIYAGLLGLAQGLDQVLDVASELPNACKARFVLVGDGPERRRLKMRIERDGLRGRVRLLDAVPREVVPGLLLAADVAIVSLGTRLPGAIPSKIYEAMAAGLPILLIANGEAARRVQEAGAGLCCSPGDREGLRALVERLTRDGTLRRGLGAAGRRAAGGRYNRRNIAEVLDECLRGVVCRGGEGFVVSEQRLER